MILTIKKDTDKKRILEFKENIEKKGVKTFDIEGTELTVIGLVGDVSSIDIDDFKAYDFIIDVKRISTPFKKVSRSFHPSDTIVKVKNIFIGNNQPIVIMAGPCAIESKDNIIDIALNIKNAGASMLRGGAYKPRTSPYSFQGLKTEGINYLKQAGEMYDLPIVSEIMSADRIDEFVEHIDLIQVGARNMQNFELLKELGKINKPILLKRGLSNTIEEWLMSAEYILSEGNPNVILCERGIRTFERATRNTLDLSVVPILRKLTHLPIVIDPSHATGHSDLVESMALAAITVGCDGLIIEVHDCPEKALSDGGQCLRYKAFSSMVTKAKQIATVIGRSVK